MENKEFEDDKKSYVDFLNKEIETIKDFNLPLFHTLSIQCNQIEEKRKDWIKEIEKNYKGGGVLYYFVVQSDVIIAKIKEKVMDKKKEYAKKTGNHIAFPKVTQNTETEWDQNSKGRILYVGKTEKGFIRRFEQHLGLIDKSLYALHLKYWALDIGCPLNLELNFSIKDIEEKPLKNLELIESVLHYSMNPILGRSGH